MANTTKTKHEVAKAVLAVYPRIDGYVESQTKRNYVRALSAFHSEMDTQTLMERIIDKAYEIQRLHNIKLKIDRWLNNAPKRVRTTLELAYFEHLTPPEIAERMGISERSAFRHMTEALDWFANGMDNSFHEMVEEMAS